MNVCVCVCDGCRVQGQRCSCLKCRLSCWLSDRFGASRSPECAVWNLCTRNYSALYSTAAHRLSLCRRLILVSGCLKCRARKYCLVNQMLLLLFLSFDFCGPSFFSSAFSIASFLC